jgi:Fe2+ transport system protein FeoA
VSDEVVPTLDDHGAKKLVSISPGTKCILIGIESQRISRRRRHRKKWRDQDSNRGKGRGLMRRLLDLGITKGCTFTVVQSGGRGPVLIEVRGTRIALGHGMARRILVKEML